jgi:general stress protein 26
MVADAHEKITSLMKDARVAMLTTMTADGKHVSRPMTLQESDFMGDIWFFTYNNSHKAMEIRNYPEVNVAFSDQKRNSWLSISGRAELVSDPAKKEELWQPLMNAWFPDGLETEGVVLIRVQAETAEYWDSPSSTVVTLFGVVRAALTGESHRVPGENETLNL